jgi:hypothetical protein
MIDKKIKKMLLESTTEDEFKEKFIVDYDPTNKEFVDYDEITHYIDQDILARCFWMMRNDLIRKEKFKRLK